MKKIIALTLISMLGLSLVACAPKTEPQKDTAFISGSEKPTEDISSIFEDATDFDDVADIIESTTKIDITENNDGSVTIDLSTPAADDDMVAPAIPTVKPTPEVMPEPTPEVNPEPEKAPDKECETKPEPTPKKETEKEPTPEVKPEPTPEVTPEPEPETEPMPTPEIKPELEIEPSPYSGYTYTSGQKHTALASTDRYLYSLLSSEQQSWYRSIDKAVSNLEAQASFNVSMSENRNYYIYFIYMFDHPEHFYLGNTVTIWGNGDGTSALKFCYSDGVNYCSYGHTPSEITPELKSSILSKKKIFDTEVNRIISTIPANAPEVVKERLIYDRILMDCHYNLSARWNGICEDNWNAYGIIVNKYGVCESYSEAFQTLLCAVGIQSTGIVGTAGGGHKWNAVKLEGEWYACDITFDDPIGGEHGAAYHYYFNRTTKWMEEQQHSTDNSDYPGPVCNGTKYSYDNCFY